MSNQPTCSVVPGPMQWPVKQFCTHSNFQRSPIYIFPTTKACRLHSHILPCPCLCHAPTSPHLSSSSRCSGKPEFFPECWILVFVFGILIIWSAKFQVVSLTFVISLIFWSGKFVWLLVYLTIASHAKSQWGTLQLFDDMPLWSEMGFPLVGRFDFMQRRHAYWGNYLSSEMEGCMHLDLQ